MFLIRNIEICMQYEAVFHCLQWQITLVELNVLTGTRCAEGADPLPVQSAVVEQCQFKQKHCYSALPSLSVCNTAFMSAQCPNFLWQSAFLILSFIEGNSGGFII